MVEKLAGTDDERGYWSSCVDVLWDAAVEGRFGSKSATGHGVQVFGMKSLAGVKGKGEH
jgi:hypothetical protein